MTRFSCVSVATLAILAHLALTTSSVQAVDFDTEIVPLFTKAGCNSGACHGAAVGRGGFKLSLLGGDAEADYDAVVQERKGRRVNLAHPTDSLVLLKPTGELPHEGGVRLEDGSLGEKRLTDWLKTGATRKKTPRRLTHFEVSPTDFLATKVGTQVPLRALARFDDGPAEDVTAWTVFTSGDPSAVELTDAATQATIRRRGQHVVIARFLDRVVPLRFTLPIGEKAVDLTREPRANFVDDEILKTLTLLRLPVSPRADDATFLRRVRLDLTGTLPTPEEVNAFLAKTTKDKRRELVDDLLKSEDFIEYQTFRLAAHIRIRPQPNDKEGAKTFHGWVREQVQRNAPFDGMARAMLTATGDSHKVGPANFARLSNDARSQAELVSQVFLGVRLQCANCHNHPLDRWTQDDYHGLAAVFARLNRGVIVTVAARGAVTNPRTQEPAIPRIPSEKYLPEADDGREPFTAWLVAPDNRYFARATVNRLWKQMFGRGLVDPTDDLRDTNPATHPELLDRLAADFIAHKFDLRHTLRLLAASETYARSSAALDDNRSDDRFYSHAFSKPLPPEVLADAIANVTGVANRYGDNPLGTRAISLFDVTTPARSLDVLGRCNRTASCEETPAAGGLPAKLHLLNGEVINRKIADPKGRLHQLLAAGKDTALIVDEIYLRAFGRKPTEPERREWVKRFDAFAKEERVAALEDFVWAVLNAKDFSQNR